jgi:RNA polymerase sigma-70 factor (ECF subfamily)
MGNSESDLISQARRGDTEAFCLLAERYQRRIYALAAHYCQDAHDAEDLSQEVWLRAYKAIAGFRAESSFYTWLRQITINCFLNDRRSQKSRREHETPEIWRETDEGELIQWEPKTGDWAGDNERRILLGHVWQALGSLTTQQRLMFLLKHQEGMTYDEIAAALGCSAGTVKKSLFRTIGKLRTQLGLDPKTAEYANVAVNEAEAF